jgi:hypothetical protein
LLAHWQIDHEVHDDISGAITSCRMPNPLARVSEAQRSRASTAGAHVGLGRVILAGVGASACALATIALHNLPLTVPLAAAVKRLPLRQASCERASVWACEREFGAWWRPGGGEHTARSAECAALRWRAMARAKQGRADSTTGRCERARAASPKHETKLNVCTS